MIFFYIQNEYLESLGQKLKKCKSELFENKIKMREIQKDEYSNENNNKKIKEEEKNFIGINKVSDFPKENEINSMQPSTEFLKKIYSRNEEYKNLYDKIEKSFIPFPSLNVSNNFEKIKNNKNFKTSINIFKPDINSSMYINEKERFKIKNFNDKISYILNEKNQNKQLHEARQEKIRIYNKKIEENIINLDMKEKQKLLNQEMQKVQRFYNFEKYNNLKNQLNDDL
jgi:hypothetical protein